MNKIGEDITITRSVPILTSSYSISLLARTPQIYAVALNNYFKNN
jgi:hypothetical protein